MGAVNRRAPNPALLPILAVAFLVLVVAGLRVWSPPPAAGPSVPLLGPEEPRRAEPQRAASRALDEGGMDRTPADPERVATDYGPDRGPTDTQPATSVVGIDWFEAWEVRPGVRLDQLDLTGLGYDELRVVTRSLHNLEAEYKRWLEEQNGTLKHRLVSLDDARDAVTAGGVVLRYPTSGSNAYLICDAHEARPILWLRELWTAITWSDAWVGASVAQTSSQHGGADVWYEPLEDGSTFKIWIDGEAKGQGWNHVPGGVD